MIVTLKTAKAYLRVDHDEDDVIIRRILNNAVQLCMDVGRFESVSDFRNQCKEAKIAVLYATAYLYEHREEADHKALALSLRALMEGSRKAVF